MVKRASYKVGNDFLYRYNKNQQKAERKHHDGGGNFGNFVGMRNGDMRGPRRYLNNHAKKQIVQRHATIIDAIKATRKSVVILASDGGVMTAIPKTWIVSWTVAKERNKKVQQTKIRKLNIPFKMLSSSQNYRRILVSAIATGRIVGSGGSNLSKLREAHPDADLYFFSETGAKGVWGDEIQIKKVCKTVTFAPSWKLMRVRGIIVPTIAESRIVGTDRINLCKLQEEHPKAKINFNSMTQVMIVSGDLNQVNIICRKVAKAIKTIQARQLAQQKKAKRKEKRLKAKNKRNSRGGKRTKQQQQKKEKSNTKNKSKLKGGKVAKQTTKNEGTIKYKNKAKSKDDRVKAPNSNGKKRRKR